jgi:hypothetical protein
MTNFLNELSAHMLGINSLATYVAALIFAAMGAYVRLYIKSLKRDPDSPNTPHKFSAIFLIWDNLRSFMAGIIICFIYFRFSQELSNITLTMFYAVGIGMFGTQLDIWATKFEGLARNKIKK